MQGVAHLPRGGLIRWRTSRLDSSLSHLDMRFQTQYRPILS